MKTNPIGFFLGLAVFFLLLLFMPASTTHPQAGVMAAVAGLMAIWWITEAIPLAATALLPLVLFPLLGIMQGKAVAPIYVNSTIFLFIGGFLIALAMERWMLHKRIALAIIRRTGGGPQRLVLGFIIAAAFLSMWISNTATAIMMLPIGLAVVKELEDEADRETVHRFAVGLMLAIAYGCSVGGVATLVGTPPNLSFARIFEITFPNAPPIEFGQWMMLGLPITLVMGTITWLLITRVFYRSPASLQIDPEIVDQQHSQLGPMSREEKMVATIFASTAVLWVFRKNLSLGDLVIPGWSNLLPNAGLIDDGTVAIAMALILFMLPARHESRARLLDTSVFSKLPWHIVLLFGGGFALAKGFQSTGLADVIGSQFAGLGGTPVLLMIAVISLSITFLTELTSNTATTEMVLPILASVAVALEINPLLLMIPATLSASCAFMMPVATPPNAIIFGSKRITIAEMARIGIVLNLIGVLVITGLFYLIGTAVFDIDLNTMPDWARP